MDPIARDLFANDAMPVCSQEGLSFDAPELDDTHNERDRAGGYLHGDLFLRGAEVLEPTEFEYVAWRWG